MSKALAPDFDLRHIAFVNPEMGCTLLDRIRCGRQIQMALWKNKTISTGLVELGAFQFFRSDGGATNHPIEEVGPTIVFGAAFGGEQSVGTRFRPTVHRVYQPKNGMRSAGSDSVRPSNSNGLEEEKNDINRSCRTGCAPVLSIRRRRKDASNRGFRHTIDFDAAFGGEQALAADFDQRHLAFSLSKVNGMHLAELDKARFGKFNRL